MDTTGPGKTVLVHAAAGGVGLAAVQLAKSAGARVFGTVSSDAKAGLAKEAGADVVINYVKDKFADEILKATGDRGVDLILDAVGKPTFEEGLRCLAPFGNIVLYGRAGGAPDPLNLSVLSPKSQKVSALSLPTSRGTFPTKRARARSGASPSCAKDASRSTSAGRTPWPRRPRRIGISSRAHRRVS
jgi:NADPH2:quinone reductase